MPQKKDPLEKLFTLAVAAELIPMPSVNALKAFLKKHVEQFPLHDWSYRNGNGGATTRFLKESEIVRARELTFFGPEEIWCHQPGVNRGTGHGGGAKPWNRGAARAERQRLGSSPLANIINRATVRRDG